VSASSSTGGIRVLRTRQPVSHIAADGSRIAVATTTKQMEICDRIVVWSPKTRSSPSFKTGACNDSSTGDDVLGIALAGKRVFWLESGGGNWRELVALSHTLGSKGSAASVSYATYSLSAFEPDEYGPYTFVGNLFGAGNLLVFNSWTACMEVPVGWSGATCPESAPGDEPAMLYSKQRLLKVVNGAGVEIASAPDTLTDATSGISAEDDVAMSTALAPAVVAVDPKSIAAQFPDGSVTVYPASGAALRSIPIPPGTFSGFALQGSQLVTIRNGRLELYDVSSGRLAKTIWLGDAAKLGGLYKGLVTYVDYRVHVLRLSDRKHANLSPPRADFIGPQIEASGLFYAYNDPSGHAPGRVVFVPIAKILKQLG